LQISLFKYKFNFYILLAKKIQICFANNIDPNASEYTNGQSRL